MQIEEWSGPNYLLERGANELCSRIEKYWKTRGYAGIRTWLQEQVVPLPENGNPRLMFFVRSNIGPHGYPPRFAAAKAA